MHSQDFLYDNSYTNGLSDIQNSTYLYLSKTGHNSTGYWGTSRNGGTLIDQKTSYDSGQALAEAVGKTLKTGNAEVNVYAQWSPYTHIIKYDANKGTGAPASQTKTYGSTTQITSTIPTRIGYAFVKWNTESNGTGTSYTSNQTYGYDQDGGTV